MMNSCAFALVLSCPYEHWTPKADKNVRAPEKRAINAKTPSGKDASQTEVNAETPRSAEERREKELSANRCTAIGQLVRKLRGFRGQTQETDRIMAGQNHAEQKQNSCWQDHKRRGRMILSGHDSVFFHLVAAWPLCD